MWQFWRPQRGGGIEEIWSDSDDSSDSSEDGVTWRASSSSSSSSTTSSSAGSVDLPDFDMSPYTGRLWQNLTASRRRRRHIQTLMRQELMRLHPLEWSTKVRKPGIRFGSQALVGIGTAYLIYYWGSLAVTQLVLCPNELPWPEVKRLYRYGVGWYHLSAFALVACIWWPRRLLYEVLVLLVFVAWQHKDIVIGAMWVCSRRTLMDHCRLPLSQEECHTCDAAFGYMTLLDVMVWVLLLPMVMLETWWMKIILCLWLVTFWCGSFLVVDLADEADLGTISQDVTAGTAFFLFVSWQALRAKKEEHDNEVAMFTLEMDQVVATQHLYGLLKDMVPSFLVAPMLSSQQYGTLARNVKQASIMFVLLEEFDSIARRRSPSELLNFLNASFMEFDEICKLSKVMKIETVKEEYVCAVGVAPQEVVEARTRGHSGLLDRLLRVATGMLEATQWLDEEVSLKIGIHTGPVVAGVVGEKLPRFRLFGDTVNTAARMMQKGSGGQIHFGQETYRELPSCARAATVELGEMELKGKGMVTTFQLRPQDLPGICQHVTWRPSRGASPRFVMINAMSSLPRAIRARIRNVHRCQGSLITDEFSAMLQEVEKCRDSARSGPAACYCRASRFRFWGDFPRDLEMGFRSWFLQEVTLRGMSRTLSCHACIVLMLTALELFYLQVSSKDSMRPPCTDDLILYIFCRCACGLLLLAMHRAVRRCSCDNVHRWQCSLVGLCCLVSSLVFISYDVLDDHYISAPPPPCYAVLGVFVPALRGISHNYLEVFSLPVFAMTIYSHSFPCLHSIGFLVLIAFLVLVLHQLPSMGGVPLDEGGSDRMLMFGAVIVLKAYHRERLTRAQYVAMRTADAMHRRVEGTLEALMPSRVVAELRLNGSAALSHTYASVTLAQSDLVGFTQLASTREPTEVVAFVSELFSAFDSLAETYRIYKIETVGDAYIAGQGGPPLTQENSAVAVVRFALGMVQATVDWSRERGESVLCRVGAHTGPCVGGIVGNDMQRYHLFGELVSCLEVLEATSRPGRVHASRACRNAVRAEARSEQSAGRQILFDERSEEFLLTSKGDVRDFAAAGGKPTFFVSC